MKIVNYIIDSNIECSPFNWGLVLFCYGCNLHCKMCEGYNFEKVTDKSNIVGNAIEIIEKNITPMHDTVVFLGGEPTIYDDKLIEALEYCKNKGLKTKIFTNGMNVEVIKKINNKNLCDAWSLDFKGVNNLKEEIGIETELYLQNLLISVNNIISNNLPLELRTTIYKENEKDLQEIKETANKIIKFGKDINGENYNIQWIEQHDVRGIL